MKYDLVICDFDGTLADTLPWMRSVFSELAEMHDFRRVEAHEFERFRDLHGTALLRELGLPLWKLPRVMNDMRRRMTAHTETLSLFPGMSDALQQLARNGVQLGIVSSNSRENVERVLGSEKVKLFTHFACGVSMFGKASKLRDVLRRSGVAHERAIYIGDEIRDAEAAAKVGIAFGAVAWGQNSVEALRAQKPAGVFAFVSEIAEKILCERQMDADESR